MRIKHKVRVQIARDSAMKNILFAPDDTLSEVVADGYSHCYSGTAFITKDDTEELSLGDIVAVKGLYLESDQDCEIELNSSAALLQMRKPSTDSTSVAKFFIEADISKVEVTAPELLDANVVYCAWGDAVE